MEGADVYQLFDSWAGGLERPEYERWAQPKHQKILAAVTAVPRIENGYVYPMEGPGLGVDLQPGEYLSLALVGDLSLLGRGILFGFGETGVESAVYRVQGIARQKDLIATLTLVDDAPAIAMAVQTVGCRV